MEVAALLRAHHTKSYITEHLKVRRMTVQSREEGSKAENISKIDPVQAGLKWSNV